MPRNAIAATAIIENERTTYEHDAFGRVAVFRTHGTASVLFGSALQHTNAVVLELTRACSVRELSHDHISEKETIARFSMSESGWASLVSSVGMGTGVPVTLESAPARGTPALQMPGLLLDPVCDTFESEVRKSAEKAAKGVREVQARLEELCQPGAKPPGKKEMEELKGMLRHAGEQFAGNMAFVQNSFARAMESTVSSAKTEVEAFVFQTATRTGIDALRSGVAPMLVEHKVSTTGADD